MFLWKKKQETLVKGSWLKIGPRERDIFVHLSGRLDHTLRGNLRAALQPLLKCPISFSFLLSVIIHLIAALIIGVFVITTSERLSDSVQVEWVKMSEPKLKRRLMLRQRTLTKPESPSVHRASDAPPQKLPPIWTAVSPETYHLGESVFLPPMPSAPIADFLSIPSSRVNFSEAKITLTQIQYSSVLPPHHFEKKRERAPGLLSMLESITPGIAEPVRQEDLSPYLREVRRKIERARKYPGAAKKSGMEGTVYVKFTILSNGKVEGIEVGRSSGYNTLDNAAIAAIKSAAPFPPFPEAIRQESLRIEVPLTFKLIEPE